MSGLKDEIRTVSGAYPCRNYLLFLGLSADARPSAHPLNKSKTDLASISKPMGFVPVDNGSLASPPPHPIEKTPATLKYGAAFLGEQSIFWSLSYDLWA